MTQANAVHTSNDRDVDRLNAMLRGERSAVETYAQCIEKLDAQGSTLGAQLRTLQASHAARVGRLSQRVSQLGGTADTDSGAWGTFAKLVEGGAAVFGEKAAIAALEQGEDHGKKIYEDLDGVGETTRQFVLRDLMPEQRRTHDALAAMKRSMD